LLTIPGAEVDIEYLFLEGRNILDIRRFVLGRDTIRIVILMRSFYNNINKQIQEKRKAVRAKHTVAYGVRLEKCKP
jgi:hypothetical protein